VGVDLGNVEFYAGPPILGGPDDLDRVIRNFISGATTTLLMAVPDLDSRAIAETILAARARKVRVQVILDGGHLIEDSPLIDPWSMAGANEGNRIIHAALLRAAIDVVTDLNPSIFHNRFIVRDPGMPTAAVLTGSASFSLTDTGINPPNQPGELGNNLNHVVVLNGRPAANLYQAEFQRLRSGTSGDYHESRESRPTEFRLGRIRVKPIFAPDQGPEMEMMKQMLKARERIDFAMFTLARSSGIDDTMSWLLRVGIPIRGVLDRGQGAQSWAATHPLVAAGAQLFQNTPGNGVRKVHHKLLVIDRQVVIAGGFNYTAPDSTLNEENIVVLGDLEETDPDALAGQQQLAGRVCAEIDRIIAELAQSI
jgi:phosphatidylserine/phosphatidylglycerophosphate/cardiolipin synthase-like enzyme